MKPPKPKSTSKKVDGASGARPPMAASVADTGPGQMLLRLRKERGLRLTELAAVAGVSASTISRIENGKISPTYGVMAKVGEALGLRWSDIVGPNPASFAPGCRAVNRAGSGIRQETARGLYEWLGAELAIKDMEPTLILAAEDHAGRVLEGHSGQELIYVLEGSLLFYMEHYVPLEMAPGDSVYFDATTPHGAYGKEGMARFLSVVSRPR